MQIQILAVTPVQATTATGKPYTKADVAYKNLSFQGKVEGKVIMPFGSTQATCATLLNAEAGSVWEITVLKNDKGYNDWTAATPAKAGDAPTPSAAPAASSGASYAKTATTTKSTYETPEERAARQVYIIRQSSLSTAASVLVAGAKTPPKTDDVITVAKDFEAYVLGLSSAPPAASKDKKVDKAPPAGDSGFDDMSDDIPF